MSNLTVLLCCLILSFLSSCGNDEALTVIQSPSSITAKEGEMAHMRCCWGEIMNTMMLRVRWNKTNTSNGNIINTRHINKDNVTHERKDKYSSYISGNCSEFTISSVSTNDTGVYLCNIIIEIPSLKNGSGPGTQLTVEGIDSSSTGSTPVTAFLIPLAAVMGAVCLCACAFLCYWRKKKLMPYPDQASGKVGMVIHEVPHEEGEEEIMESEIGLAENEAGSSRSSHSSTQWCAVPVYESYFAVQTSEDR